MVFLTASGVFLSDSLRKDAFMSETTFSPANSGFLVVNKPELPGVTEHSRQRWQVPGFVLRLLSPL
ncbi:sulfonate ABC transporter permease, partial [Pseudomonas syringae pv. actinidiae ICMP 18804]